jgi:tripartite ATP-independent transporter DctP family solute receptor
MFRKSFILSIVLVIIFAVAASSAPREIKIGYITGIKSPLHQQALLFKAEVEKRLPGQIEVLVFPSAQLGKENAQLDALRLGSQDMGIYASGIPKVDKKFGIFDLPWLFADRAHVIRAVSGSLFAECVAQLKKSTGLHLLGMYENGFRHVINKVRAVKRPDDLKGLKIRITGGKFRQGVFASLGANPAPVAWSETFTALQTGVVDGAEAATYGFYSAKLYELAKHLSLTRHVYTPTFLVASNRFMKSLASKQKAAFLEAGQAITKQAYASAENLEVEAFDEMKKAGVKINEIDFPAFQEATRGVYKNYIKSQGDVWLKKIQAAQQ